MRTLGLLADMCSLLLVQAFGTLALEVAAVAGVQTRAALLQMQDVIDGAVEEFAVVRNHHQHARIAAQPLLQPQHRVEVEVIGRLVQQQQIRRRHQRSREVQPPAPAAGKLGDGFCMIVRLEAQPVQQAPGTRAAIVASHRVDAMVRSRGGGVIA